MNRPLEIHLNSHTKLINMFTNAFHQCAFVLGILMSTMTIAHAQEKAFQIDFEKNDQYEDAIYSHTNGAWITVKQQSAIKKNVEYKIIKYSPDFEKKEWEKSIKMGSWSGSPMYYEPSPSYIYYFDEAMGVTIMNKTKLSFQQISPTGEVKKREVTDEKSLKYLLMGFCDSLHYYQLAAVDNPGDFVLFRYTHDTWKQTKFTLSMPVAVGEIKANAEWHLAGRLDKTISFIRYGEKKAAGIYQMATFDISTGKIVHNFVYKYDVDNPELVSTRNIRFDAGESMPGIDHSGKFCLETKSKSTSQGQDVAVYNEAGLGNIIPALDGKHYYFVCAVTHSPTKLKLGAAFVEKADGVLLLKMDHTGKMIWKQVYEFKTSETSGIVKNYPFVNAISLRQTGYKPGQIALKYAFPETTGMSGIKNIRTLSYLYDASGKKLESAFTDSDGKNLIVAHKVKLTDTIKTYFSKKDLAGTCAIRTSGNSAALFVTPEKTKNVLGVVYFKDLK
jgi:hypothetical protein